MAPTVTRLILSFALLVATPVYYIVACLVLYEIADYGDGLGGMGLVTFTAIAGFAWVWYLIWFHEVQWTPRRRGATWGVFFGSLLPGGIVGGSISMIVMYDNGALALVFGGLIWLVCWLFGTALVWKETAAERAARVAAMGMTGLPCPSCGYNLMGLRESRCPECGAAFTLDQLFAAVDEQRRPSVGE